MTISFVPSAGDVLMCDFDGFKPPEMTKIRPVIILSPRSRRAFPDTYIVVPTSRTPPASVEGWHCQLKRGSYPCFDQSVPIWAKCDRVTCIAARRLDLAEVAHLSPRQFSRAFQAETGLTPAKAAGNLPLEGQRADGRYQPHH